MKTIVALVDFSVVSAKVLDQSLKIAKAFDARVIILHGVPAQLMVMELGVVSPTIPVKPPESQIELEYEKLLDFQDAFIRAGVKVEVEQLEPGDAKTIVGRCNGLNPEMIVVGAHHHSALYELFVGTFTGDVLKLATCPVLVVPADVGAHLLKRKHRHHCFPGSDILSPKFDPSDLTQRLQRIISVHHSILREGCQFGPLTAMNSSAPAKKRSW